MDQNEKYVRSKWKTVEESIFDPHEGYTIPQTKINIGVRSFIQIKKSEAYADAAAFTREREEQIRQAEENVRALGNKKSMLLWEVGLKMKFGATNKTEIMLTGLWTRELCAYSRVLAREQAALAKLKRGMK